MDYVPGDLPAGYTRLENSLLFDSIGNPKGFRIINRNIDELYRSAFVDPGVMISKIIVDSNARLFYDDITETTNSKRYLINNSYCYESSLPEYSFKKARRLLQLDLERAFGMTGQVVEQQMNCIVLYRLKNKDEKKLWTRKIENDLNREVKNSVEGYVFKNTPFIDIISTLGLYNRSFHDPIIIDETDFTNKEKYSNNIDIVLNCSLKYNSATFDILQKEFANYGIGVKMEKRMMKVLLLKSSM